MLSISTVVIYCSETVPYFHSFSACSLAKQCHDNIDYCDSYCYMIQLSLHEILLSCAYT